MQGARDVQASFRGSRTIVEVDDEGAALLIVDGEPMLACPNLEEVILRLAGAPFEVVRAS